MEKQTAGRKQLGSFAPKFAELNDDILFGQVWSRKQQLSLRERSIITVCILMAKGITDSSLKVHISEILLREEYSFIISKEFIAKSNATVNTRIVSILFYLTRQSGYSESASLLAHNLIAADAAYQQEPYLLLIQVSSHPPLMSLRH